MVPVESTDKPEEYEEPEEPSRILNIDPIICNTYSIKPIEDSSYEILPNEIIKNPGEIVSEKQVIEYEYTPSISGTYRFEFSDVPNGTDFALVIYHSGWEKLASGGNKSVEVSLSKDESYIMQVTPYQDSLGDYKLTVEY